MEKQPSKVDAVEGISGESGKEGPYEMRGLTPYSERPKSWGRKDTSARSPDALRRASA